MYCKKCGNEISFDASFCTVCGNKVETDNNLTCPRCNHVILSKDVFCKTCGYNLSNKDNPTEIYSIGYLLDNDKNVITNIKTISNYSHLKPFKLLTNIISVICSLIFMLAVFLPIFATKIDTAHEVDLFNCLMNKDLSTTFVTNSNDTFSIKSINIITSLRLIFVEGETSFSTTFLNHVGLFVYGFVFTILLVIFVLSFIMFIISIIGIIKKKFYNTNKVTLSHIFAFSLSFFFGFDCPGIGLYLITLFSFLLIIFYYIIEIVSTEKKFNVKRFIAKSCLVALLSISIIFVGTGTFVNTQAFDRLSIDSHGFKSNILSQTILQMVYITDPKYSASITNIYVWLSSLSLFASILGLFFIAFSLSSLLTSFSNINIPSPIKKISIGVFFLIIALIMDIIFADFVFKSDYALYVSTLTPSEIENISLDEINSLKAFKIIPTVYYSFISLLLAEIYSFVLQKILAKTKVDLNYIA